MKKTIISLAVLLGLGGGAYYTQTSGLYDLKQFIPSQLTEYLPSPIKEYFVTDGEEIETITVSELDNAESEPFQDSSQPQMMQQDPANNRVVANDEMNSPMEGYNQNQMNLEQNQMDSTFNQNTAQEQINPAREHMDLSQNHRMSEQAHANDAIVMAQQTEQSPALIAMEEIEAHQKPVVVSKRVQALDASPEEMKIVRELNKVESTIVKLDNENEDLQMKYNQMLQENRELALRIKDIDQKIKTMNSQ